MGFWKNLRAILSKPDILDELAATQERLRETERELDVCIGQAETNDLLWESPILASPTSRIRSSLNPF